MRHEAKALFFVVFILGCGGGSKSAPSDSSPAPKDAASSADGGAGMGAMCGLGCAGFATCTALDPSCADGVCVFDGTNAYCTRTCASEPCPSAFDCSTVGGTVADAPDRVCIKAAAAADDRLDLDLVIRLPVGGAEVTISPRSSSPLHDPSRVGDATCDVALRDAWDGNADAALWVRMETCDADDRLIPGGYVNGFEFRIPVTAASFTGAYPHAIGNTKIKGAFDGVDSYWEYLGRVDPTITAWSKVGNQVTIDGELNGDLSVGCRLFDACESLGEVARLDGTFRVVVTP